MSDLLAAPAALVAAAVARAILAGGGHHGAAGFGDEKTPGIGEVVDDERAAVNKLVQRFEDLAKSWRLLNIGGAQPVEVARPGIDIGLEDGVELLALLAGVVERNGVDSNDAPGAGMDAGGLDGQRHIGKVRFLIGRVGLLRLLLGRWVRFRFRLGFRGVWLSGGTDRAAGLSAALFHAWFGRCGPGRVARSYRRGRRRWGRRRRVLRGGARCVVH